MPNCDCARLLGRVSITISLLFALSFGPIGKSQAQEILTNESIRKMQAANLSEATIIAVIEQQQGEYSLADDALKSLRQAGVSENVIQALQRRSAQPGATPSGESVAIPDGTTVKLRLKTAVSSGSAAPGGSVPVELAEDLVVGGVVAASRNTPVPTVVKTATPAKRFHGDGTLELEFQRLVLADGTQARLRQDQAASHDQPNAAKKAGKAIEKVSIGGVKRGKDVELGAGQLFTARVDGTVTFRGQKTATVAAAPLPKPAIAAGIAPTQPAATSRPMAAAPQESATVPSTPLATPRLHATFFDKPARVEFSDASGAVVASHALLKDYKPPRGALRQIQAAFPAHAVPVHITSPSGVLYVLQRSLRFGWAQRVSEKARISAFDLNTGTEAGNAEVSIATEALQFTSDDSRLIAFGPGHPVLTKDLKTAVLAVLDPATLQTKFIQDFGSPASMMHYVPQLDRVMVIGDKETTLWFVDPVTSPAPAIELGGPARGAAVSSDGTRLLVLVRNTNAGGKKALKGGTVNQFDISTGRLLHSSQELSDAVRLTQLGNADEYWVLMRGRMQRLTHEGDPAKAIIPYAEQDKEYGRGLGGLPGSSLGFGKHFAINVLKSDGSLAHKVALIDPETGRVDSVAAVGRPGVRRSKVAKRWAIALALDMAMAAAGGAAGAQTVGVKPVSGGGLQTVKMQTITPVYLPGSGSRVSDMAVSQDQQTLYVMDAESDDVTAVKSDGAVAATIPVKSVDSGWLWSPPKGRFLYYFEKSAVSVIDTAENKVVKEIPIEKGFEGIRMTKRSEFYLCDKRSCEVWNAVNATSIAKLDREGLSARLAHADEQTEDEDTPEAADAAQTEPASTQIPE